MGETRGRWRGRGGCGGAARAWALALHLVSPCVGAATGTVSMQDGGGNAATGAGRGPAWHAVPEAELADARGGFDAGGGRLMSNALVVSFSIERLLTVNGAQVAADRLALAGEGGSAVARHEAALQAVQVGGGNLLLPSIAASGPALAAAVPALLLQNTANGQFIRAQTTINTTVNSLATLKELNFGDSLRQALATAAAPR